MSDETSTDVLLTAALADAARASKDIDNARAAAAKAKAQGLDDEEYRRREFEAVGNAIDAQARLERLTASERGLNGHERPPQTEMAQDSGITEDELASVLAERGESTMRWTPAMGWMVYAGTHWQRDDMLAAFDLARTICREAASANPKVARQLRTAKTRNAVVALAQADPRLGALSNAWDCDPFALNTPLGVVDLRTGSLRPRTSADLVTMTTAVAPAAFVQCPRWLQFLAEVFLGPDGQGDAEMIDFIQRSIGYWLTGDRREQVLWFCFGLGSNGKSVLLDLVMWLMGSYAMKLPSASLMQARGERHPTDLASMRGKRLAVSSELEEGQHFAESLVKELTGDATLTARFMRMDFFTFMQQQKHVVVGNTRPRLHGGDAAMARRMMLVPFNAKFAGANKDDALLEKLKAEGPGILRWAINGAVAWATNGLSVPESVRTASAEYMADHDDLRNWMAECCQRIGSEKAQDLYDNFRLWKEARGERAPSLTSWGTRMQQIEGIGKRRSGGIVYDGIALTSAAKTEGAVRAFDHHRRGL